MAGCVPSLLRYLSLGLFYFFSSLFTAWKVILVSRDLSSYAIAELPSQFLLWNHVSLFLCWHRLPFLCIKNDHGVTNTTISTRRPNMEI